MADPIDTVNNFESNVDDNTNQKSCGKDEQQRSSMMCAPCNAVDGASVPVSSTVVVGHTRQNHEEIKLGGVNGSNGMPAYALLVGLSLDDVNEQPEIVSIPITRLPVTLGKDHVTKDPSFIGLRELNNGDHHKDALPLTAGLTNNSAPKLLSQSMCCIFYRDAYGGKLGLYKREGEKDSSRSKSNNEMTCINDSIIEDDAVATARGSGESDMLDEMIYKPYHEQDCHNANDEKSTAASNVALPNDILRPPGMDIDAALPTSGFFAIECTGRKITVNKQVLKKGQCAMLQNGTTIQIASYCFYFLLPDKNGDENPQKMKVHVMKTMPPMHAPAIKVEMNHSKFVVADEDIKKNKTHEHSDHNLYEDTVNKAMSPPSKKTRISAGDHDLHHLQSSSPSSPALPFSNGQSDKELLRILSERIIEATSWDHENQKLGSTLAIRACRAAAKSKTIQRVAREEGGVTQRDILLWMNDRSGDSEFVEFETMMLTKITKKSFMMSIGKAIARAGYIKNELLSGRAIRWNLPEDVGDVDSLPHATWDVTNEDEERINAG